MRLFLRFLPFLLLLNACNSAPGEVAPVAAPILPAAYDTSDFEQIMQLDYPVIDSHAITLLVDEMLGEALTGMPQNADPRTLALHLNWYAHSHLFNANPKPNFSMLRTMEQRSSICGGSSLVLQLLARRVGIPTRTGAFYGVPIQGGHVVAELYWDDRWHFFDPTFGTFFTADGTLDGEIVSLQTLLKYQQQVAPNAFYAISDGRLGWNYTSPKPDTIEAMYAKKQTNMLGAGNYRRFLAGTHAGAVFDTGEKMTFPFAADLSTQTEIRIGEKDKSALDIIMHVQKEFEFDATALQFIGYVGGITGPLVVEHSYSVTGLKAGDRIEWRSLLLEGGAPESLRFDARKGTVEGISISGRLIRVTLRAARDNVELHVSSADDFRNDFDFIAIERK